MLFVADVGAASAQIYVPEGEAASGDPQSPEQESGVEQEEGEPSASGAPIGLIPVLGNRSQEEQVGAIRSLPAAPGTEDTVAVSSLGAVSAFPTGILKEIDGGFPMNLWEASERLAVESYMPRVPISASSRTMQSLASRLLLTRAYDPAGATAGYSIFAQRLDRLYQAGWLKYVEAMVASTPQHRDLMEVGAIRSKTHLLRGQMNEACTIAAQHRAVVDDPYWLKLRALCYLIVEDMAAASLSSDLLAEQGLDDPNFYILFGNVAYETGLELDASAAIDPIHIALARMSGTRIPAGAFDNLSAPVLLAVSELYRSSSDRQRLGVAVSALEMATARGAVSIKQLQAQYSAVVFSEAELSGIAMPEGEASPFELGFEQVELVQELSGQEFVEENQDDLFQHALLWRRAQSALLPEEKVEIVIEALEASAGTPLRGVFPALYSDILRQTPASVALEEYAVSLLPIYLEAGLYRESAAWMQALQEVARGVARVDSGHPLLDNMKAYWAVRELMNPNRHRLGRSWSAVGRLSEAKTDAQYRRAVLEVEVFEALGVAIPDEARLAMLQRPVQMIGSMPEPSVLASLDSAARLGRLGEAVLFSLVALGADGPGSVHPAVLAQTVSALKRIGLEAEARQIAIEALLLYR